MNDLPQDQDEEIVREALIAGYAAGVVSRYTRQKRNSITTEDCVLNNLAP